MNKKIKVVKSKCLTDALVWLGFEYTKTEEGYEFERNSAFDLTWDYIHTLKQRAAIQRSIEYIKNKGGN